MIARLSFGDWFGKIVFDLVDMVLTWCLRFWGAMSDVTVALIAQILEWAGFNGVDWSGWVESILGGYALNAISTGLWFIELLVHDWIWALVIPMYFLSLWLAVVLRVALWIYHQIPVFGGSS